MDYDYNENCYRISCKIRVNRKDVFLSLKNLFSNEDLNDIAVITREKNNLKWLICVKNAKTFEKYLYREIEILGKISILENMNDFILNFRILWLPPAFNAEKVACYVSEVFNISPKNVVYIKDEKCNEIEMENISNGIWNIKLNIDLNKQNEAFSGGIKTVKSIKSLFIRKDERQICLLCEQSGHIKKNCPNFALFCTICKNRGHKNENCSMHENASIYESVTIYNEILAPKEKELVSLTEDNNFQKFHDNSLSCSSNSDYSNQYGRLQFCTINNDLKKPDWNKIIEDVNKNLLKTNKKELETLEISTLDTTLGLVKFIFKIL
jgi:hypothetical protein